MRYRTFTRLDHEVFADELNECAKDGYIVISAGASYNLQKGKLEWWAVVGRQEETQQAREAAELLEAAKTISDFCGRIEGACTGYNDGAGCPLFDQRMLRCKAACRSRNDTAPKYWVCQLEG